MQAWALAIALLIAIAPAAVAEPAGDTAAQPPPPAPADLSSSAQPAPPKPADPPSAAPPSSPAGGPAAHAPAAEAPAAHPRRAASPSTPPGIPAAGAPGAAAAPSPATAPSVIPGPRGVGSAASDDRLATAANQFYLALARQDVDALATLCRAPFYFEDRVALSAEELKRRWSESLQGKPLTGLRVRSIELLGHDEMVQKFGKMPERLAVWPKGLSYSVADFEGHAVVVGWRKSGEGWHAAAIHD